MADKDYSKIAQEPQRLPVPLPPAYGGTGGAGSTGTGSIVLAVTPTISTPNLIQPYVQDILRIDDPTAGQIWFPSTQHPSTDANILDDYAEATWTPVFSGITTTGTVAVNANYIKIGRLVTYEIFIGSSGGTVTSSSATCNNFPFTPSFGFFPVSCATDDLAQAKVGLGAGNGSLIYLPDFSATSKINIAGFCFVTN